MSTKKKLACQQNKKCLIVYTIKETLSGYDGDNDPDPPSIEGDDVCPYCRLSPCIIARPIPAKPLKYMYCEGKIPAQVNACTSL